MRYRFRKTVEKYALWGFDEPLLIAVSGGVDSMALLDLCRELDNPIAVAHCNFGLRGAASDKDEELVKKVAQNPNLPIHTIRFSTADYAKENGISIEMAARDLRYAYFKELCQKYGYSKILTAHHANDNAETFLLNLAKGTGIKGLTGIPRVRESIVRPLLNFSRTEILEYAKNQRLEYREDLTNTETIYQRNKIRHSILPILKEVNPAIIKTLNSNMERLQEMRDIYENHIVKKLQQLVKNETISIVELQKEKHQKSLLFEWLQPYGFATNIAEDVVNSLSETEEKQFFTENYRLVKSRGTLQITTIPERKKNTYAVTEKGIENPIKLEIKKFAGILQKEKHIGYFAAEKLEFPLKLRHWKVGDKFVPFGLKGSKKVSELFKDAKLNTLEKENVWLLCSGEKIIWVVGLRTADFCKITPQTKNALQITWKKECEKKNDTKK